MKTLKLTIILLSLTLSGLAQTTKAERQYWNNLVDFVKSKGYIGVKSSKLNDINISKKLFDQYSELNNKNVDYTEFVIRVQTEIVSYRNRAIEQIKSGKLAFDFPIEDFMKGLSNIDGIAGEKTFNYKFPKETFEETLNVNRYEVKLLRNNNLYVNN